ncbi:MAG TPA: sigma-70 family RNA polymerase sigma factor [Flavobacteriales bacterium]|jgi:RNA polymerase sigma-70 factor (ECF subfamily)|nr:sigma-70 family RNA polymerase sigma factor [Flavobacteriales bacterium]HHZ95541.1 sigma-70 family RNA polymerase sigma factor [Flavobacteriales bacterium]HIB77596.1 sigma-70 family RNA polymerase sigma factor [Flavobacteriales bacterium]HIN42031.1 sigma-70 family RNA polymerase sigma factor [Flavobacteriales bacterium]HIO60078.1 sigma-70 family RNA polymerase sigma factor [Flavobacteriales bacterium]
MQNKDLLAHIEGCRQNREKSRSWIFNRYYRLMFGVCLRYVSDRDAVQDVVQEGFLKIFSNIDGYTSKGSFEGWMRRIMVNTAIDAIRHRKATGLVLGSEESLEEIADEGVFPIEDDDDDENFTVHDVQLAMAQLTPMYRMVFNLHVFDNMGHKEISDHLGISVGTSKSNLAKARRNLRKILLKMKNKTGYV